MITTLDNLDAGLTWWCQNNWGKDFLNEEYTAIYAARAEGITIEWWEATLHRLGQWRAYRGPAKPNTKAEIRARGLEKLAQIGSEFNRLSSCAPNEPTISDFSWEQVAPLFELARQMKESRVFCSKMCHFVFPKLFIPTDNQGSAVFEYEFYWRGMQDEWSRFFAKHEARNRLADAMKPAEPHPLHPFESKILELCHIGYEHR
jgi:hypothetical protein